MITCLALRVPLLAAEINRARPHLTAQLRERLFQTEATETVRNPRSKSLGRTVFFLHGIAEDIAHLFFHAAAMLLGALLQARLHLWFEVAHNELGRL
jgi:hypothetical protein